MCFDSVVGSEDDCGSDVFPNGLGESDSESQHTDAEESTGETSELGENNPPRVDDDSHLRAHELPPLEDAVCDQMKASLLGEVPVFVANGDPVFNYQYHTICVICVFIHQMATPK